MSKQLFNADDECMSKNRQKLIDSLGDTTDKNSEYIFQDEWVKVSEVPIPSITLPQQSIEDFEQQKKWLLQDLSHPEQHIDFQYLTPLAEHLLYQKESISQVEILHQITSFLRHAQHEWNQPNQTNFANAVWSKANLQLLAFSTSFCGMHQLTKEYLQTHPFHLHDFSPLPELRSYIQNAFQEFVSCNIFYFESTLPCRSGKFVTSRHYLLPNSLFIVTFFERCEYYSDCMVIDGLKFEPHFITTQTSMEHVVKCFEFKFKKLRQIMEQYKTLHAKG